MYDYISYYLLSCKLIPLKIFFFSWETIVKELTLLEVDKKLNPINQTNEKVNEKEQMKNWGETNSNDL